MMFCAIVNVTPRWDSTKLNDILILKRITKKSPFLASTQLIFLGEDENTYQLLVISHSIAPSILQFWTEPAAITYFVVHPSIIAK
jgi:hypothetical protein